MRVVGISVPDPTSESQRCSQQQRRAERMGVVDRECVGIIPALTPLTRIGKILKAIQASACGVVLIREFPTHQIVVGEAMVDLNIKLLIGIVA